MNSKKPNHLLSKTLSKFQKQIGILGIFVVIFWLLEILDIFVFQQSLNVYGIQPRTIVGLRGILFAPFLHGGFRHLISNTIPFITLGWLVMVQETSDFYIVTAITMLVGGIGVWLLGATGSVHIGASILIFGYLGFLLLRGWFQRNFTSIFLSVVALLFYGNAVLGILPSGGRVSWEGHLFGFLGGILAARMIAKEKKYFK